MPPTPIQMPSGSAVLIFKLIRFDKPWLRGELVDHRARAPPASANGGGYHIQQATLPPPWHSHRLDTGYRATAPRPCFSVGPKSRAALASSSAARNSPSLVFTPAGRCAGALARRVPSGLYSSQACPRAIISTSALSMRMIIPLSMHDSQDNADCTILQSPHSPHRCYSNGLIQRG